MLFMFFIYIYREREREREWEREREREKKKEGKWIEEINTDRREEKNDREKRFAEMLKLENHWFIVWPMICVIFFGMSDFHDKWF